MTPTCVVRLRCWREGISSRGTWTVERWACTKPMKFNKAMFKVLHMCQSNLKQKYRLGRERLESSPEDDLELLVDKKLRKTQ